MQLSHKIYGAPVTRSVVLLHGLLGSRDNWHSFASRYEKEFCFIVPDLVNHGASPHVAQFDYATMALDVISLLKDLRVERASFVGHSMGGKVAMEIALSYPRRTESLVIEDMIPGKTTPRYEKYVEILKQIDLSTIASRRNAEAVLEPKIEDRMLRLFLLKNLARSEDGTYRWRANLQGISDCYHNIWAGLTAGRTYPGRCLFIRGGQSDTVGDSRTTELGSFFPEARIETIPEAGHWIHAIHVTEFDELAVPFIRS
jgi:esterase